MLNELLYNQKVYVELTNPIHGGPGWEFGTCLWSPSKSRDGKDAWAIMKKVKPGDIILHSLKINGHGHKFVGHSTVLSSYRIVNCEPPFPDRWGGMDNYFRIDLKEYSPFNTEIPLKEFLSSNKERLPLNNHSFYGSDYLPAQKYLAEVPIQVLNVLMSYFNDYGISINNNSKEIQDEINSNNHLHNGNYNPQKTTVQVTRTIRDTKIIKDLKEETGNRCQICGKVIMLSNGKGYSEGHHLQPLGNAHNGPDVKENVIILCPNHHTEFDYGSIGINPRTMKIVHINNTDELSGQELAYTRHDINNEYLNYHYKNIFNKK